MKLSKVEISAFRIFDRVEDATFDFVTKANETADFVALYAPNGFGKTSFYDAVEWGMTKSIGRFMMRSDENKKLADSQSHDRLIQNINSINETFVNIQPASGEPIFRKLTKKGKQRGDFIFNRKTTIERPEFQTVILSQEWISAFLMESNGEIRFEKFMRLPELAALNQYYKNLKALITACNAKTKKFEDRCRDLEQQAGEFDGDDLLENVNSVITELRSKREKIELLSASSDKKSLLDFRDQVSSRLLALTREQEALSSYLAHIEVAKSGNDEIGSLARYLQNVDLVKTLKAEIGLLEGLAGTFASLKLNENLLRENIQESSQLRKMAESLSSLLLAFTRWQELTNRIQLNRRTYELENSRKERAQVQLETFENEKATIKARMKFLSSREAEIKRLLREFPKLKDDSDKTTKRVTELSVKTELFKERFRQANNSKSEIESEIQAFQAVIEKIRSHNFSFALGKEFKTHNPLLKELQSSRRNLDALKSKITVLDSQISDQKSLSSDLENFVKRGLEFVNSRQLTDCPLCTQAYESTSILASRITGNPMLDKLLQETLLQKSQLGENLSVLHKKLVKKGATLISAYEKAIKNGKSRLADTIIAVDTYLQQVKDAEEAISDANAKLVSVKVRLDNKEPKEYRDSLNRELRLLEKQRAAELQKLDSKNEKISESSEALALSLSRMKLLEVELKRSEADKAYLRIRTYFQDNFPRIAPQKTILNKKISEKHRRLETLGRERSEIENTIASEKEVVKGRTRASTSKRLDKSLNLLGACTESIEKYDRFLKVKLSFTAISPDRKRLLETLKAKEQDTTTKLRKVTEKLNDYTKLEMIAKNVEPYLLAVDSKRELVENRDQISFWRDKIGVLLTKERDRVRDYLNGRVRDFFFENLINQLYDKIDPHPNFKKVEFKPDFESDPPRLDVIVTDADNHHEIIPNLYYSTAQINILSTSIFLASALNSKDYDCIFIDDPVQSMDSINILSTIDLLRSLVVNHGKQIILSTHDQNFHKLLQKKMPPELFRSKFLELESFGKVKSDVGVANVS
ncbi:MAG: hypothetical protein ACKVQW_00645 [Pyrinomonadaceae bacterium]